MTLEKRRKLEETRDRIDVAEDLLDRIGNLPSWYFERQKDEDGNVMENDEGWPVFNLDSAVDEYALNKGVLALELNKLVYDTCMKWIDGKK